MADPPLCNKLINEYKVCVENMKVKILADYDAGKYNDTDFGRKRQLGTEGSYWSRSK